MSLGIIQVIFWPHSKGLEGRLRWFEDAFPRATCNWAEDYDAFAKSEGFRDGSDAGFGAVIIINGSTAQPDLRLLGDELRSFRWAMVVSIGDEGSGLHLEWLKRPHSQIWVYDGKPNKHDGYRRLPAGSIKEIDAFISPRKRTMDWFASGSIRDIKWDRAIQTMPNGVFYPHHLGFKEYAEHLSSAKIVPCRPSFTSPETCRVYDALEAGAVPIVGTYPLESVCNQCKLKPVHPHVHQWWPEMGYDWDRFWPYILGDNPPFPVIKDPEQLHDATRKALDEWSSLSQRVHDWWQDYKVRLVGSIRADAERLR